jgi:hypothetical protein
MKINQTNNSPSFGMVSLKIYNNGRTGFFDTSGKKIIKLVEKYNISTDREVKFDYSDYLVMRTRKIEYILYTIKCLKKNFATNDKLENDLSIHLKNGLKGQGLKQK